MQQSVAIIEDNPTMRANLVAAVASAEHLVLVGAAGDLPEALQLLNEHKPNILLVDLDLPSGNGLELIKHAAQHLPDCMPLVITMFADENLVVDCIEAGAMGYLLKGASNDEIVNQINAMLAGGSPISPAIARRLLKRFIPGNAINKSASLNTSPLSSQEQQVLTMLAKGYTYAEVAQLLNLAASTIQTYIKRIYRKLQVNSKTQAIFEAKKLGILHE